VGALVAGIRLGLNPYDAGHTPFAAIVDLTSTGPAVTEHKHCSTWEPIAMHSVLIGYLLWVLGFFGAHRFYFGKPISGTIWFFTLGLLFIGWIIDLLLIPSMCRDAEWRFMPGPHDYNVAWILLAFLGVFGVHRFYLGKWITGVLYLLTGGLFGLGYLFDLWTLNSQVDLANRSV
jgi:TM2 domain-containing membrane protein YozV